MRRGVRRSPVLVALCGAVACSTSFDLTAWEKGTVVSDPVLEEVLRPDGTVERSELRRSGNTRPASVAFPLNQYRPTDAQ